MESVRESTALDSDLIEEPDRDWLPILSLAIPLAGHIFTIDDIKSLRSTCKVIKALVDPFIAYININIDTLPDADYNALATSSLLTHIRKLDITEREVEGLYDPENRFDFFSRHYVPFKAIVQHCAPKLERLGCYVAERNDLLLSKTFLDGTQEFPSLKEFSMNRIRNMTVPYIQRSLLLMTALEKLSLTNVIGVLGRQLYDGFWAGPQAGLPSLDLQYLVEGEAPFIENITELELTFGESYREEDKTKNSPSMSLFQKATNLRKLTLDRPPYWLFLNDIPFNNLEYLEMYQSRVPFSIDFFLPRSLLHLNLTASRFSRIDVLLELLTLGTLPLLKSLVLKEMLIDPRADDEHFDWNNCIQKLNLPSIESIYLCEIPMISNNVVFHIGEAATNKFPNLKEYKFQFNDTATDVVDPDLVRRFCRSSVAANLESLILRQRQFDFNGLKELIENASSMKRLEKLEVYAGFKDNLQPEAFTFDAWPNLKELKIHLCFEENLGSLKRRRKECLKHCKKMFNPIWPDLQLLVGYMDNESMVVPEDRIWYKSSRN